MAKGQLHSTGTVCRAEIRCPIEDEGGQHFDSVDELVEHTATQTGADASELRGVLATGVSPAEAVSMAREGVLGNGTPQPLSRQPLKPSQVKELDQFDPAVHSVFSNGAARTDPNVAARALKKEVANGEWMGALSDEHADLVDSNADPDYIEEDKAKVVEYGNRQKASEARQAAMAKEMLWLADNVPSYRARLPKGAHGLLQRVQGYDHSGISIGTVRKAPAAKG